MNKEYDENRSRLAGMIKNKPSTAPIQQVKPIVPKEEKDVSHLNFWIPTELFNELKMHAIRTGSSIKQVGIDALEAYLKKNT
ncbi:hypothetical protein GCM10007423_63810 [Dyadobacter endophyticus]|uniref:CopG family transcriptional regulator n=1 Tax=Dyadobacter endophyticus TaxID=1749036 RepID=A0ABQ1ZDW4_9BACT|nr:hypothetical protein [Dyadobacter endophyticus]GGH55835.1 hypothetical protein GCM10007423_63810 [Dyadobacter endophyticus]